MAYDIETGRWVIRIDLEPSVPLYFGFQEIACNNLTGHDGSPVREVVCAYAGIGYHFMQQVIEAARHCETGCLTVAGSRGGRTLPERYIKKWREAKEQAMPLESYLEEAGRLLVSILDVEHCIEEEVQAPRCIDQARYVNLFRLLEETEGVEFINETFLEERINRMNLLICQENLDATRMVLNKLATIGYFQEESAVTRHNFHTGSFMMRNYREALSA